MEILDCTLRDGGYYTNWDFDKSIVNNYLDAINNLPIEYIEIGYRSKPLKGYFGEYFYLPLYLIKEISRKSTKKLVLMIDEKNTSIEDIDDLLGPVKEHIEMIRLAVNPANFMRAIDLAKEIKKLELKIGLNMMYMSKYNEYPEFIEHLPLVDDVVDYLYMVDSYGGVMPNDVKEIFNIVRSKTKVKIGFHGHNNLELGLINTLTAIDCGVDIVDATITGMGRGAGNLKTELLLTALNSKGELDVDFNYLTKVVDKFSFLQEKFGWGTNLPYMVSGANSLPQKDVMEWVGKRFYSYNTIIRTLNNKSKGISDNIELNDFKPDYSTDKVLIIGGGPSATNHAKALNEFLKRNPDIILIHTSSKNVKAYELVKNKQIHCLSGNEGYRLESIFNERIDERIDERIAVLPPFPRKMGTYVPNFFKGSAFQISSIRFDDLNNESVTTLAVQIALDLNANELYFVGYDGYREPVSTNELELFNENKLIFSKLHEKKINCCSLTQSDYEELSISSVFAYL
jgi:4-hydroxy 2-oxovalerate aldolase